MDTLLREPGSVDLQRLEQAVRELLEALGEDPDRETLRTTPARVARMYAEICAGSAVHPSDYLRTGFEEGQPASAGQQETVLLRDISFASLCEHHLLPFYGRAHVGYLPNGRLVGLSKIARVVDAYARRLQLQERLTNQIADCLMDGLQPDGVAVVLEAEHLCIAMRGVNKPGSRVITSAVRGDFRQGILGAADFLALVQGK